MHRETVGRHEGTTDQVASWVERYLLDMGVRVPEDIAIATADSGPEAQTAPVPITTFGMDYLEVARIVVELAEKLQPPIDSATAPRKEVILFPLHLTVRESCGAKLMSRQGEERRSA